MFLAPAYNLVASPGPSLAVSEAAINRTNSPSQVYSMASEAHTKLDFAMLDRASLRQRMEEEH
jgi:hypothetical protein